MIGKIEEIYVADESAAADWALVRGDGPAGTTSFLPLRGSRSEANEVIVPFTRTQVTRAPHVQYAIRLSPEHGAALYEYYGISDADGTLDEARLDGAWEMVVAAEQRLTVQLSRTWQQWLANMRGHNATTRSATAADEGARRSNQAELTQGERHEDDRQK